MRKRRDALTSNDCNAIGPASAAGSSRRSSRRWSLPTSWPGRLILQEIKAVIRPHHTGRTYDCNRPEVIAAAHPCETGAVHIWIPTTDTDIISAQHFWTGGLETAGPGCYDAVAIARTNAGYEPASVMRRLSLNRSEPAKKSGQNIPKNRYRTTIAERMVETPAELPFIGDQVVCLSHNQAARSGPRKECLGQAPFGHRILGGRWWLSQTHRSAPFR